MVNGRRKRLAEPAMRAFACVGRDSFSRELCGAPEQDRARVRTARVENYRGQSWTPSFCLQQETQGEVFRQVVGYGRPWRAVSFQLLVRLPVILNRIPSTTPSATSSWRAWRLTSERVAFRSSLSLIPRAGWSGAPRSSLSTAARVVCSQKAPTVVMTTGRGWSRTCWTKGGGA